LNPNLEYSATPLQMLDSFWSNRYLIWQMIKREILGRYKGSILGIAWSFFHPILMLVVYTFVFAVVFKARWDLGDDQGMANYALVLFTGLIVHGLFADCINRAPTLMLANVSYVKKIIFPLEILPIITMGSSLFHAFVSIVVLLGGLLILQVDIGISIVLFPLVLLPLVLLTLGVAWFVAATGVYIRDLGQIIGISTTVLLFTSPIFFPLSAVPEHLRHWVLLNPITFIVEQLRLVIIWSQFPNWSGFLIYCSISLVISWLGFWWFQRTRKGFADVV